MPDVQLCVCDEAEPDEAHDPKQEQVPEGEDNQFETVQVSCMRDVVYTGAGHSSPPQERMFGREKPKHTRGRRL